MILTLIIFYSLLCSLGVVFFTGIFLFFPESSRKIISDDLLAYSVGILLGTSFLGFIPRAINESSEFHVFSSLVTGIIMFFMFQRFIYFRFKHISESGIEQKTPGTIVLFGDSLHSFVDGIAVTSTFLFSVPLGIITSVSVISHQIPQKLVNYAVLLESGFNSVKSFKFNFLASLTIVFGSVISYIFMDEVKTFSPYILSFSAASFIYISIGEIMPKLNHHKSFKKDIRQILLILCGIITILFLEQ